MGFSRRRPRPARVLGDPFDIELAIGAGLVEALVFGGVRRRGDTAPGSLCGLLRDLQERIDELIERFLGFRFGGLDHERFRHNQWEIRGWGVDAEIEEAFGNIDRFDTLRFLPARREDDFVHTRCGRPRRRRRPSSRAFR